MPGFDYVDFEVAELERELERELKKDEQQEKRETVPEHVR